MPEPDPSGTTALTVTWNHVLKPGSATHSPDGAFLAEFDLPLVGADRFSLPAACFLAAQSLLIYFPTEERHRFLNRHDLVEVYCEEIDGTLCSAIESKCSAPGEAFGMVVYRGTSHLKNWLTNLHSLPTGWPGGGHVHGGFAAAHQEVYEHLAPRLERWEKEGRSLHLTGHSLGGALATLTLSQFLGEHPGARASAYTFGSPRVGNATFAKSLEDAALFRVVNGQDLVTRLPLPFSLSQRLSFLHSGNAHFISPDCRLHSRGQGDTVEEQASLSQIKKFVLHAADAFKKSRPPEFLADHAPARYLEKLEIARRHHS